MMYIRSRASAKERKEGLCMGLERFKGLEKGVREGIGLCMWTG
jgi:hypothetical protein